MAIPEYNTKVITFKPTHEQAEFLRSLANRSEYIREAIKEKMERESNNK